MQNRIIAVRLPETMEKNNPDCETDDLSEREVNSFYTCAQYGYYHVTLCHNPAQPSGRCTDNAVVNIYYPAAHIPQGFLKSYDFTGGVTQPVKLFTWKTFH